MKKMFLMVVAFLLSVPCFAASDDLTPQQQTVHAHQLAQRKQQSLYNAFEKVFAKVLDYNFPLQTAIAEVKHDALYGISPDSLFDEHRLSELIKAESDYALSEVDRLRLMLDISVNDPDKRGLFAVKKIRERWDSLNIFDKQNDLVARDKYAKEEASRGNTAPPVPSYYSASIQPPPFHVYDEPSAPVEDPVVELPPHAPDTSHDEERSAEEIQREAEKTLFDTITKIQARKDIAASSDPLAKALLAVRGQLPTAEKKELIEAAVRYMNSSGQGAGGGSASPVDKHAIHVKEHKRLVDRAALRIAAISLGVPTNLKPLPAPPAPPRRRLTPTPAPAPAPSPVAGGGSGGVTPPPVIEKWYQRLVRLMYRMPDKRGCIAALIALVLLLHGGDSWMTNKNAIAHDEIVRDNARPLIEKKHGVMDDTELSVFAVKQADKLDNVDKLRIMRYLAAKQNIAQAQQRRKWARWETLAGALLGGATAVRHYRQAAAAAA